MRPLIRFSFALTTFFHLTLSVHAQDAKSPLDGVWTVTECEQPECAYYDPQSRAIYVSNIAGNPTEKDGRGWISKISLDGKLLAAKWVDGLDAPKGIRSQDGVLWVTNIDELVSIDIESGKIKDRIKVDGENFLNDVVIGPNQTIYLSDTFGNKIYAVQDGKASTFAEGEQLEGPNGLIIHDDELIVAPLGQRERDGAAPAPGHLYSLNLENKAKRMITNRPLGNLDGLELDGSGGHFVSDWSTHQVFRVTSGGMREGVLSGVKGPADIGVVPEKELLVVPRMLENKVTAYDFGSLPIGE